MFDFYQLFSHFRNGYYSSLIMTFIELLTIIIALRFRQHNRVWLAFIIYLFTDFIILISDLLLKSLTTVSPVFVSTYFDYTNTFIAFIELTGYYYFFYQVLPTPRYRAAIKFLWAVYTALMLLYFLGVLSFISSRFSYLSYILGTIEFILIIPFCLGYFRQLLTTSSKLKILSRPGFWITTGIFFYCIFSIPSYLLNDYIKVNLPGSTSSLLGIFYYMPLTINFIFLAKAFSLKRPLTD